VTLPVNYRTWDEVKAQTAASITDQDRTDAHAAITAEVAAYRLSEIRRSQHRTQTDIATAMGVGQRRVSTIESGALLSAEVGTIASYVNALGGQLRLIADFGDRTVLIQDAVHQ